MSLDTQRVRSLLAEASALASSTSDLSNDEQSRTALLSLCQKATSLLQQPDEHVGHLAHSGGRMLCVRIADDLHMFNLLCEKPQTARQLAESTGAEEGLIVRVLRMLNATGFADYQGQGMYGPTPSSKQMTMPSVKAGMKLNFNETLDILQQTPHYFKENGYKLPRSMTDTPFQYARQTELDNHRYWAQKRPWVMDYFQDFMNGLYGGPKKQPWWSWYPIRDLLANAEDVAFVDVAGGRGHEIEAVVTACPDTKGRFVLQDLPEVIDAIQDLDDRVERIAHDFLTRQPTTVEGAKVFFLSNILHDHPDGACRTILENIRAAMRPGYSRLLISNFILSEHPPLHQLDMDMSMLFLSGGAQRSELEWTALLESAGFRIVKFWYPPGDQNGIVEAEKA